MPGTHADAASQADEFWDDLLAFIEERQVIPVVGGELLELEAGGRRVPLQPAVAATLLRRYGLEPAGRGEAAAPGTVPLRARHELSDAVGALAQRGQRIQNLYRPVNDALREVLAGQSEPVPALAQLAAITHFDLFVSVTFDDLLARAIDRVRFEGAAQTESIAYAPNLSSDKVNDIPERPSTGYTAVFHIFGKASASPQFAIHDEDLLEFVYGLQAGRGHVPERMLGAIRSRSLLLIGCNFADWLSRFFLRAANQTRLFGDRDKREFLVDADADASLTLFLERFSQNTRVYPGSAAEFVAALYERWRERHPSGPLPAGEGARAAAGAHRSGIFVSYSSGDRAAARALVEALRAIGGDVVWFDRHDLTAGADWRGAIVGAIRRCSLFLPLVSAGTEARPEGFFRLEWDEACDRDRTIQGRPFLIPVVIDPDYAGDAARYALLPDAFRKRQFGHAPRGVPSERLAQELRDAIRGLRRSEAG